jgi:hypothetical protein
MMQYNCNVVAPETPEEKMAGIKAVIVCEPVRRFFRQ